MPVTVVPTSLATVAIDTFITELSSVIRNCPDAKVRSFMPNKRFIMCMGSLCTAAIGRHGHVRLTADTVDRASRPTGRAGTTD